VTGVALIVGFGGSALAAEGTPSDSTPVVVPVSQDGVQRATITLDSYSYSPGHLIVQAGKPVELTLTSVTVMVPHNFVLDDAASGLNIDQNVAAGKTVTIRFTPEKTGTYTFYCNKQLLFFKSHREKGMEGRLEVR
jgi:heme/copper-type cytochrome/quinol oxidase subunit 2